MPNESSLSEELIYLMMRVSILADFMYFSTGLITWVVNDRYLNGVGFAVVFALEHAAECAVAEDALDPVLVADPLPGLESVVRRVAALFG